MPKFDFKHLEVRGDKTADYLIVELDTPPGTVDSSGRPLRHPKLICAPATEATKPYWSRSLKRSGRRGPRARIDEAAVMEGREEDLELFPLYIVKGWEGVFDSETGKPVAFSRDACREFLTALPGWIFNNLRIWAKDPVNFLDEDAPSQAEVETQGNG